MNPEQEKLTRNMLTNIVSLVSFSYWGLSVGCALVSLVSFSYWGRSVGCALDKAVVSMTLCARLPKAGYVGHGGGLLWLKVAVPC